MKYAKPISSLTSIKELHAHLIRTHLHRDPSSAISEVVRSYALSPATLHKALIVFDEIERPTSWLFSHLVRGLSQSNEPVRAIEIYRDMYRHGISPHNGFTFVFVFKSCAALGVVNLTNMFHVHAVKSGHDSLLFVSNALIRTYAYCSDMVSARRVFDEMLERDLVSWNSLICGYSQCSKFVEVLSLFDAMRAANVRADAVTMVKVFLACRCLGNTELEDCAVEYLELQHIDIDVYLGTTLIDMYASRGLVESARSVFDRMHERNVVSYNSMIKAYTKVRNVVGARKLFDEMPERDVISWTSMISGYAQSNDFSAAVKLFQEMMAAKVKPDEFTVATVLSACAHLGSLDVGKAVHDYIRQNRVKTDIYVGNALIDMYCKCGSVDNAMSVFREMKAKDSVSWTSVITGLAVNGFADSALELFSEMEGKSVKPTCGTFVGVLLACSHAGLVDKGLEFFKTMEQVYRLVPEMKHYGCVVDLLSRSGNLNRAYEFITKMPVSPDVVVWRILLSACKVHGDVALAETVMKEIVALDPRNSGNYVLLSNAYASSDRWFDSSNVREVMKERDVQKPFAWSSIEEGVS